ncbi:glycosyltransferase family 2 protein [Psychrobacter faecalis]|uniref:glycosyltransferase family 2 protein n=1 Tax=Psychrobacter faecalis TaxID=180588 RepID=UPI003FD1026E
MFSIIIPLYNKELSIKKTIESVLNQTCQDFEIVVINDGSTDKGDKIVESITDNRIRLIQQENQGVSAARNRGIKEASYDWIAFLDADDLWEVNHLEEINKMMALFPNEKIYVTSFEYSDGRAMFKHARQTPVFKIENYFKEAVKERLMWTSIVVVNKSCFENVEYFNVFLNRGEDLDLWARLAKKYSIIKSKQVTATYRVEAENRSNLCKDIRTTHVYYINLTSELTKEERVYYTEVILNRLYAYNINGDIINLLKLKSRHPSIKWIHYNRFILTFNARRLNRLLSKYRFF